jgi:hypothetical protein
MNRKETSLLVESWRNLINEETFSRMPTALDRKMAPTIMSKEDIRADSSSNSDKIALTSASIGFFEMLIDATRFGLVTKEEVNKICNAISDGCDSGFNNMPITHQCLNYWKKDIAKYLDKVSEEFKSSFCANVKSNCELAKSNYDKARGNIKMLNL